MTQPLGCIPYFSPSETGNCAICRGSSGVIDEKSQRRTLMPLVRSPHHTDFGIGHPISSNFLDESDTDCEEEVFLLL